jgi:hypothetical protein
MMKVLAIYPGRFQPWHRGHYQVYQWLRSKFGDAVIATSNKVEAPKSPFNFEEKKRMMVLAGVPSKKIKHVTNPYVSSEILKEYDPKTTVLVFAVSQKDMDEDPRFSFKNTKSGKPGYLQPYNGNEKHLKPFGDASAPKGYVIVTPTFTFNVLGKPATSASELRKQFVSLDNSKQKEFIKDLFGTYDAAIHKLMDKKIGAMMSKPKTLKHLKEELTRKELAPMLDSFVSFASEKLGIKSLPVVRYKDDDDDYNSFAAYNPSKQELSIATKNRHPMDVFRSVAHELVHHKQKEEDRIGKDVAKEGETGSDIENEANAEAGKIMRWFAKENPTMFTKSHVVENTQPKAIFLAGGPGSGKDFVLNNILSGQNLHEINTDTALAEITKKNGMNFIINGSAYDVNKITNIKNKLDENNYSTMMIFVNTSNEVSKQRNIERGMSGGRMLSEEVRSEKWNKAQKNMNDLKEVFGNAFAVVDNSIDLKSADAIVKTRVQQNLNEVKNMVKKFVLSEETQTTPKTLKQIRAALSEEKKMGNPCWKGYKAYGTKKKNGKEVPNCTPVDEAFEKFTEEHGAGDEGTNKLRKNYEKVTPGQPVKKNVLAQEEDPSKQPWPDLPVADGIGPEISVQPYRTFNTLTMTESIKSWVHSPRTQQRFAKKYGDLWEQKLLETATLLEKAGCGSVKSNKKTITKLKENWPSASSKIAANGKQINSNKLHRGN